MSQRSGIGINQAKGVSRGVLEEGCVCGVCRVRVLQMEETAYLKAKKKENTPFIAVKEVPYDKSGYKEKDYKVVPTGQNKEPYSARCVQQCGLSLRSPRSQDRFQG